MTEKLVRMKREREGDQDREKKYKEVSVAGGEGRKSGNKT